MTQHASIEEVEDLDSDSYSDIDVFEYRIRYFSRWVGCMIQSAVKSWKKKMCLKFSPARKCLQCSSGCFSVHRYREDFPSETTDGCESLLFCGSSMVYSQTIARDYSKLSIVFTFLGSLVSVMGSSFCRLLVSRFFVSDLLEEMVLEI